MFGLASLALIMCSGSVAAHGGVVSYTNNGDWYWGWKPNTDPVGQTSIQRPWLTNFPIEDATASTLACNDDGTSSALQLTATVKAGSAITAYWSNPWPHPTGPVLTYLAQCPGSTCTGVNANDLKWFKIDEAGLINGTVATGTWAAKYMIDQNNSWTSTIPSSVPTGNYLIRFETIALHAMPAQLYPECAQLSITDGGSLAPTAEELVTFPGAYNNSELGLTLSLYSNAANFMSYYPIPGPPLYAGAKVTVPSLPKTPPPSACSATPSGPGTVPQYGQCGGQGWTGGTVCMAPYICTYYYAQCL